jgi:DNA polymerase beta
LHLNRIGLWRRKTPALSPGDKNSDAWEMLPCKTEEQIFQELGMDYIEPEKRHFLHLKGR